MPSRRFPPPWSIEELNDACAARILQSVLAGIDYGIGRRRPQWYKQD